MNASTHSKAHYYNGDVVSTQNDIVAVEVGLRVSINSIPYTVTMQTPGNEIELVKGLLYSEGICTSIDQAQCHVISYNTNGYIDAINVEIDSRYIVKDFVGTRNVISASSCGLCGKTEWNDVIENKLHSKQKIALITIQAFFEEVSKEQLLFRLTGGTHAAGLFDRNKKVIGVREDIGRHNAVDKVIGHALQTNKLKEALCLTVSGRLSFEIVHKAHRAQIPFLASVSAPSSLAVSYAEEAGICLIAFCRGNKCTVYSQHNSIIL